MCELLTRLPSWEITYWIAFYLWEQDQTQETIQRRLPGRRDKDRVLKPRTVEEAVSLLDTYFDVHRHPGT